MTSLMPMPDTVADLVSQVASIDRPTIDLYKRFGSPAMSLHELCLQKTAAPLRSSQGVVVGRREHPFDFHNVLNMMLANEHHSTCINTKTAATVGLGFVMDGENEPEIQAPVRRQFKETKVDRVLNPLADSSFQEVICDACQDFWQIGNGYIEVVREGRNIVGLHHLSAEHVFVYIEDDDYNRHFEIVSDEGTGLRRFACFGDKDDFLSRAAEIPQGILDVEDPDRVSEVIHFRQPSSLDRWYGYPDWLAAVPSIELNQMMQQHRFDFFLNRGVPEFMLFIMGAKLPKDDWEKIETALKANIGLGNSHKSVALNLQGQEMTVQLEKLAMEGRSEDSFSKDRENLALSIVSAHRVPPLLAGIQIPGKLGATNELPNALMAFQLLVVGQAQRLFQMTLGVTLGGEDGIPELSIDDFTFRRITDEIDLGMADTMGRMRQTLPEAQAEGRDLGAGVRE